MKLKEIIHGFQLDRQEYIEEIKGTANVFHHLKTGAQLIYVSNTDDNKVFHIAFKTPSDTSTGVAHILEHSVLCGSRKYPVKEPFVELAKGSLNTFLNAMTYPDKTVYPIASTNEKDFMNLMDVYLDAVFYPEIYTNEEIFMQEGWHYHLEDAQDPITYNGVVYNEMKGVYSSPEEYLQYELQKALYPHTIYSGESGGHPDTIPALTYEDFLAFHKTFYHPSNAFIYLYGDGEVEEHLAYLDEQYLSHFDAQVVESAIAVEPAFEEMKAVVASYPISAEDDLVEKDYLSLGFVLEAATVFDDLLAMDILGNILLGHNGAPLKKALLDLDICKEVDYFYTTSMKQPNFAIVLKNTSVAHKDLFVETVRKVLMDLVTTQLEARSIEAAINSAEFTLKEGEFGSYPKGLMYGLEMMDTWLYDGDPLSHLKYEAIIDRLRASAANRGFEAMIMRYLLNNTHKAIIAITPDAELAPKKEAALTKKLADYKAGLSQEAVEELVKRTNTLLAHQSQEDSPESLETIPKLSLDEIGKEARHFVLEKEHFMGNTLLWHPGDTNGIIYVKYFFDTHTIPQEDMKYLSLLVKLMGRLRTTTYLDDALNQEMDIYTGGISTSIETYDSTLNPAKYQSMMTIKGKAIAENFQKLTELMESITLNTCFDQKKIMGDIIGEIRMAIEQRFLTAGNVVSLHRLQSYYSQSARLFEEVGGIEFYQFLAEVDDHFDERYPEVVEKLTAIVEALFIKNQAIVSLTAETADKEEALKAVGLYLTSLRDVEPVLYNYHFPLTVKNEGFKTASKVQYVSKGYNVKALDYQYSGSLLVLKSILSMDYLWSVVRVQGGAYGASFGINKAGELSFSSYRDPNVARTVDAYNGAAQYISQLNLPQRELEKYIIGTISSRDTPLSVPLLAAAADTMYFNETTQEDIQRERDQILATTTQDLKALAEMVGAAMDENMLCVVGGEDAIEADAALFNEVKYIK